MFKATMLRYACFVLACLAARACAQGGGPAPVNLLENGGFESGGTHDAAQWAAVWPRTILKNPPTFDRAKNGAHGGKACAVLEVPEAGGYCSFTQQIASPPRDAKSVHVEGWIAFTPDPRTPGEPSIMILMVDPSKPGEAGWTVGQATLPKDALGWTKVEFDATVPAGASQWLVRCGMAGCGNARFDDVVVTASSSAIEAVSLIRAHGDYVVVEDDPAAQEPWIAFSLPFPFEGQTPLAVKLTTDPPDRVARVAITKDDENRHLRVHVKPQGKAKARTTVRLDALVMVRERPAPAPETQRTKLVLKGKVPPAVARYFEKTPGIDADDEDVKAIAKGVNTETLEQAVDGVLSWMRENFKYEGGGDQGGSASLARKSAVCTGHANLAASLFQAAGVPCRILGCLSGERLQEHYIVEVWTPSHGWHRIESTTKMFPIPDRSHLILHVAHPTFPRSDGNVPLYIASQGCSGRFDLGKDDCFQGMGRALPLGVDAVDANLLETTARAAFTAWERTPSKSVPVRLLPPAVAGLSPRGAKVIAEVEAFLAEKK